MVFSVSVPSSSTSVGLVVSLLPGRGAVVGAAVVVGGVAPWARLPRASALVGGAIALGHGQILTGGGVPRCVGCEERLPRALYTTLHYVQDLQRQTDGRGQLETARQRTRKYITKVWDGGGKRTAQKEDFSQTFDAHAEYPAQETRKGEQETISLSSPRGAMNHPPGPGGRADEASPNPQYKGDKRGGRHSGATRSPKGVSKRHKKIES